MAGRKSKTATAGKPQRKSSSGAKTASAKTKAASAARKAKPASKTSSVKKAPVRKTAAKKTAAKKAGVKKPAAKKPVVKKAVSKKTVGKITAVKKTRGGKLDVHAELERLAAYIDAAKREIADIRPDVKEDLLPTATDQLDAVVEAAADATNAIMDSCEVVESVMGDVSAEVSNTLMGATTKIYEACSFQDITGQRIGKVVTALKTIEKRIDTLVETLEADEADSRKKPVKKPVAKSAQTDEKKEITDEDLLEGPQLGDKAKSQAEIDDLLASFD